MQFANINFKFIVALFISVMIFHSCGEKTKSKKKVKTIEVLFKKEGELSIVKQKVDTLIAKIDIEIAATDYETQTGLMYRKSMEKQQGMLFIFPDERLHSFYMKNTEFPLDLIFIKKDLTIASFQENAQPFDESPLPSQVPIQYVLELNAGLAQEWLLEVGDKIVFSQLPQGKFH